jgi:hypothetical protein
LADTTLAYKNLFSVSGHGDIDTDFDSSIQSSESLAGHAKGMVILFLLFSTFLPIIH